MTATKELLDANAAYYRAFNTRDSAEMNRIWANDPVSCIHPGWPVLIGRTAVIASYRRILDNLAQETLDCRDAVPFMSGSEGRVLCTEAAGELTLAVTNWFTRTDGGWRMIHHQASLIAEPQEHAPPPRRRLN